MQLLKAAADEGKPAHAYLFTGREGIGKRRIALRFACLLNCPTADDHVEGSCPVCRRIVEEKHPDVTIERPERGMIRIDRVRSLQSYLRYAPIEARYRVAIIDDAHLMNRQAQSALLKTLEEPPPARVLVLVSSKPSLLLPTVRSRCRRMRFRPVSVETIAGVLEKELGIAAEKARFLAAMSGGSPGRALKMEASRYLNLRDKIISAIADPGSAGIRGILDLSEWISSDRTVTTDAIEIASAWIRDVLLQKVAADPSNMIHGDFLDRIASSAQHHSVEVLLSVYDELVKASGLIEAEINVNKNLVTDVMLLKMIRILAGPDLGLMAAGLAKE